MTERRYTLREIDDMRDSLEEYLRQLCFSGSHWTEAKEAKVEDQLRTYLQQGLDPTKFCAEMKRRAFRAEILRDYKNDDYPFETPHGTVHGEKEGPEAALAWLDDLMDGGITGGADAIEVTS